MNRALRSLILIIAVIFCANCAGRRMPADYRKPPETYYLYVATCLETTEGGGVLIAPEWRNGAPVHISTTSELAPLYRAIAKKHGPIFGFRGVARPLDATTDLFIHGQPDPIPLDGNQTLFEFTDIVADANGAYLTLTPWFPTGKYVNVPIPASDFDHAQAALGKSYKLNRYQASSMVRDYFREQ